MLKKFSHRSKINIPLCPVKFGRPRVLYVLAGTVRACTVGRV